MVYLPTFTPPKTTQMYVNRPYILSIWERKQKITSKTRDFLRCEFSWVKRCNDEVEAGSQEHRRYAWVYMDVSTNNGTPKSSHFNRVFHYKPSILGFFTLFLEPSIYSDVFFFLVIFLVMHLPLQKDCQQKIV